MNRLLKAIAAIMLITMGVFIIGCKPEEGPINGGGNNGDNGNEDVPTVALPFVETGEVSSIGRVSAYYSKTIVHSDEGSNHFNLGVCYDTNANPTLESPSIYYFGGERMLVDLIPNTTYYVRGFARNPDTLMFGEQVVFTTLPDYPCYINGKFSISEDFQVYFSQGNLQFRGSPYTWRFAENQWDYVGTEISDSNGNVGGTVQGSSNHLISNDYEGWIDLFAWGSGSCPTFVSGNITDFVDWGTKPISNAGGHIYPWRTLTDEEWDYILYERQTSSGIRFTKAIVNDVRGLVLLPDDWNAAVYQLNNINDAGTYTGNVISETIWKEVLEAHGAVFLPCAGKRILYDVSNVGAVGYYWSTKRGWYVDFIQSHFPNTYEPLQSYYGLSVRLVWCAQDAYK